VAGRKLVDGESSKASKGFFFEKKKQKKLLLLRALAPAGPAPTVSKSFLVTFFKKVTAYFMV
jgi:hypothetical protein